MEYHYLQIEVSGKKKSIKRLNALLLNFGKNEPLTYENLSDAVSLLLRIGNTFKRKFLHTPPIIGITCRESTKVTDYISAIEKAARQAGRIVNLLSR